MGAVYARLSVKERVQIERWRLAKVPVRELARTAALQSHHLLLDQAEPVQ